MRVTLTGATGLLGGNLATELLNEGHEVRATRRSSSRIDHLSELPIEWVEAELGDVASLRRAFEGAERVYHCAGVVTIRKNPTPFILETNVEGTRHVMEAVRAAGVPRLVHCSTTGAVGLSNDGRPVDESAPWNYEEHGIRDAYVTTKRQAEELVIEEARRGLDVVVVNPSIIIGPYDPRPSTGKILLDVIKGKMPGWFPGKSNFVGAKDVARGMILAGDKGEQGERYILAGEDMYYRELFEMIAEVAGVRPPRFQVPRLLASVVGYAGDLEERLLDREPLLNSVTVGYGFSEAFLFSSAKAKRELGYEFAPVRESVEEAVRWFREQGMF